jgi:iron complex outermembrane recepter protein
MTRRPQRQFEPTRVSASACRGPGQGAACRSIPLAAAVAAVLGGCPVALAQQVTGAGTLEEVVVTSQKREESLQHVPLSVIAIGTVRLEELEVRNFNDYAKFLPSVAFEDGGPGFARVFMRGVANGDNGNHSGPQPSVGTYLDEQPITTIQGALDIHIYDIARVEALAGPQGTLYGASSQAGTLRIITNKPDPGAFSAAYDLQGDVMRGSGGYVAEGYVNLPLAARAAVRLVGWSTRTPGYIDNVAGTDAAAGIVNGVRTFPSWNAANGSLPFPANLGAGAMSNAAVARRRYNDVEMNGGRAALKVELSDSWTVTPAVVGQTTRTGGVFFYDPVVGDLALTHFFPENSDDTFYQAALTVEGRIGNFDLVYAGAFMKRDDVTRSDYSDYSFFYDQANGSGVNYYDNSGNLINPSQYNVGRDGYRKQSHELRLSSPKDRRFRFVAGLFWQSQYHNIEQNYKIAGLSNGTGTAADLTVHGTVDDIWLSKQERKDWDRAAFTEMNFDLTDKLTATGGIRFFSYANSLKGFFGYAFGYSMFTGEAQCPGADPANGIPPPYVGGIGGAPCTNLDRSTKDSGNTPKLGLTYKFDEQRLVYATYSKGFRPGGQNRRTTFRDGTPIPPYKPDFLTNYEIGWKTSWAANSVRFNGALFWLDWKDFQYSFLGANGLTIVTNAGGARIKGVEADLQWAATHALTLTAGATLLDSKLTADFCQEVSNSGVPKAPPGTPGLPADQICPVSSFAASGSRLPVSPKFKGNVTARYLFAIGDYEAHLQGALIYQSNVLTSALPSEQVTLGILPPYGTADFAAGLERGPYSLETYVTNAFDKRTQNSRFINCTACSPLVYITPGQPRMFGVRFGQKFGAGH